MLETINDINWHEIESWFGTGEEIPVRLREIMSDDSSIRESASDDLQELIFHQGSICEATAYTVPFLFELLPLAKGQSRESIMWLLYVAPDYWGHLKSIKSRPYEQAFVEALADGFDTLVTIITDPQTNVSTYCMAIGTISFICIIEPSHLSVILPRFMQLIESDQDESIQATAIYYLGQLFETLPEQLQPEHSELVELFQRCWRDEFTPVSFASAVSLAWIMKSQLPVEIEDYLIKAIVNPLWVPHLLQEGIYIAQALIMYIGSMDRSALLALWNVGISRSIKAVGKAIQSIDNSKRAREYCIYLLDWICFGHRLSRRSFKDTGGVYPKSTYLLDISQLDVDTRQAFLTVLNCENVWAEPSNFLEMYGLPANLEKARLLFNSD